MAGVVVPRFGSKGFRIMKKNKKANAVKRLRRQIKGLIISWEDPDPKQESSVRIPGKISHRNPGLRIGAEDTFRGLGQWLATEQRFKWLIEITGVFVLPNGSETHETRELEAFCTIEEVNPTAIEQIDDIRRHGSDEFYKTIRFKLECIGLTQ